MAVHIKNRVDPVLGTTRTLKDLVPWHVHFFVPKYRVFCQHYIYPHLFPQHIPFSFPLLCNESFSKCRFFFFSQKWTLAGWCCAEFCTLPDYAPPSVGSLGVRVGDGLWLGVGFGLGNQAVISTKGCRIRHNTGHRSLSVSDLTLLSSSK